MRNAKLAVKAGRAIGESVKKYFKSDKAHHKESVGSTVTRNIDNVSQHNDLSTTHIYVGGHRSRHVKKHKAYATLQHQQAKVIQGLGAGLQMATDLTYFGNTSHFLNAATTPANSAAGAATDAWPISPFELNPYKNVTGSAILSAQAGVAKVLDRLFLHDFKGEMMFNNPLGTAQEVQIYFVMPKHTLDDSPLALWQMCIDNVNTSYGLAQGTERALGSGANPTVSPSNGQQSTWTYGATPFQHKQWLYKVVGSHKFVLATGCTKKIKWTQRINKMVDRQVLSSIDSGLPRIVKGLTLSVFVIARGVPVYDKFNNNPYVTPSDTQLMYTSSFEAKVSFPSPPAATVAGVNYSDVNFGYQPITGAALATEKLMNDVDTVAGNASAVA